MYLYYNKYVQLIIISAPISNNEINCMNVTLNLLPILKIIKKKFHWYLDDEMLIHVN